MAICPGGVDTKMIKDLIKQGVDRSGMKLLKPEEVAKKIYDMISNQKKNMLMDNQQSFIIIDE